MIQIGKKGLRITQNKKSHDFGVIGKDEKLKTFNGRLLLYRDLNTAQKTVYRNISCDENPPNTKVVGYVL